MEDGGGGCPATPCPSRPFPCCDQERLCANEVCEGVGYVCGTDPQGSFAWLRDDALVTCQDGDTCTINDQCVNGKCRGEPVVCTSPPQSSCIDPTTLRAYSGNGSCVLGVCEYPHQDTSCPQGCAAAACTGNPCLGVTCDAPPSTCHRSPGTCVAGSCSYDLVPAGTSCTASDSCTVNATCDAQGVCAGTPMSCSAANTATASCVAGVCKYTCESGYGNCNGSWSDGCETALNTTSNCGSCGTSCKSAAHATVSCVSGSCKMSCTSPYKNCDGSAANGCEIPVGVANRCDKSGLNSSTGCGTAYCGSSSQTYAANFGSWTCVFCSHCHLWSNGYSWCLYSSGMKGQFSSDRCSSCCNASLADKVCPK